MRYHAQTGQFLIDHKSLELVALSVPYIIKQIKLSAGLPLDKYKHDGPLTPADHAMHAVLELADRIGIEMGARWGEEMDVRDAG